MGDYELSLTGITETEKFDAGADFKADSLESALEISLKVFNDLDTTTPVKRISFNLVRRS